MSRPRFAKRRGRAWRRYLAHYQRDGFMLMNHYERRQWIRDWAVILADGHLKCQHAHKPLNWDWRD